MFSKKEEKAIKEKLDQLNEVKQGKSAPKKLAKLITERRVKWINEHLDEMLEKYKDLPILEKAYKIVFLEHMKINPEHLKISYASENKIRIDSYNPCPYLEACKELKLKTEFVCKDIVEPSIKEMLKIINPNLRFGRNYNNIRSPDNNKEFCEEYIFLKT